MSTASKHSFLIVDDTDIMRDLVKLHLENDGHKVTTADSGNKAIEILQSEKFDVILLDIEMPDMDGIEVLKNIRAETAKNNTKIIMLTANKDLTSVKQCLGLGANDYMLKPFNSASLMQRVNKLL